MLIFRFLYPFFLPGGLFFASGVLLLKSAFLAQLIFPYLLPLFLSSLVLTLLLAVRFQCNRLIFALIVLPLAVGLNQIYPLQPGRTSSLCLLLPLNLSLILLLPEKRLGSSLTAIFGSSILLQGLFLVWLEENTPAKLLELINRPLPFPMEIQTGLLQVGALVIALSLTIFCFRRRPQPLEAAFFWMVVLTAIPFYLQLENQFVLLFFSLSVFSLLTGILETSHNMAYRDELTGIPGRRALNQALNQLGRRYSLAMLDIDHFKKFNDTHGHDVGDQVLKMVAGCLARVNEGGRTFRYGGEEFAVVFPNRRIDEALPELEQLRRSVAAAAFIPRAKNRPAKKPAKKSALKACAEPLSVTISIGVAEPSHRHRSVGQVLSAADQALYRAKKLGRNRVDKSVD